MGCLSTDSGWDSSSKSVQKPCELNKYVGKPIALTYLRTVYQHIHIYIIIYIYIHIYIYIIIYIYIYIFLIAATASEQFEQWTWELTDQELKKMIPKILRCMPHLWAVGHSDFATTVLKLASLAMLRWLPSKSLHWTITKVHRVT